MLVGRSMSRIPNWKLSRNVPIDHRNITVTLEFFTNPPQHKNDNIANVVSAVPSEWNWTNEVCNLEMCSYYIH